MALLNPVWLGRKTYASKEDRRLIEAIFVSECVLGATHMAPSISAGNVMSIAAGKGVVDGDTNADQGFYLCTNDAAVTKTHVPDPTNPKIDRLVLTVNDFEAVGSGPDSASFDIIAGTPVSGASLTNPAHWPAVGNTQMPIAKVLVPSGAGGIVSIVDDRIVKTSIFNAASYLRAWLTNPLSVGAGVTVVFDTKVDDPLGQYNTANGRFTPIIAGRWLLLFGVGSAGPLGAVDRYWISYIRKNGLITGGAGRAGQRNYQRGAVFPIGSLGQAIVQANGTTDWFDVQINTDNGSTALWYDSSQGNQTYLEATYIGP